MKATVYKHQHHITNESVYSLSPEREDIPLYGAIGEIELPEGFELEATIGTVCAWHGGVPYDVRADRNGSFFLAIETFLFREPPLVHKKTYKVKFERKDADECTDANHRAYMASLRQ